MGSASEALSGRVPGREGILFVGRDKEAVREYIRNQEQEDKLLDQMNLWR